MADGRTLTCNGPIDAGLHQIFSGSKRVNLAHGLAKRVYPEWWGARGDGSDDTAAVQAAIDSLHPGAGSAFDAAYRGQVILGPGTYGISSVTMKSNVDILGSGLFSTQLRPLGKSGYLLDVKGTDTGHRLAYVKMADFSIVTDPRTDFFLESSSRSASGGINLSYCTGVKLERIGIWNISGIGINQVENYDCNINDCHLVFVGSAAHPAMTMLSGTKDLTNAVHVSGCRFEACSYGTGIKIAGGAPWKLVREIQFTNCKFENCPIDIGAAFAIGFHNCQFTHNFVSRAGIRVVGHPTELTYGIKLVGCGFHTSNGVGWAIDVSGPLVHELIVVACNFSDQSKAITGSVIILANSQFLNCATPVVDLSTAAGRLGRATVTGCSFVLNQGSDYCVKAPGNIRFADNAIRDPAVKTTKGIFVQSDSNIHDNTFSGMVEAIHLAGAGNVIRGNQFTGTAVAYNGPAGFEGTNFIETR